MNTAAGIAAATRDSIRSQRGKLELLAPRGAWQSRGDRAATCFGRRQRGDKCGYGRGTARSCGLSKKRGSRCRAAKKCGRQDGHCQASITYRRAVVRWPVLARWIRRCRRLYHRARDREADHAQHGLGEPADCKPACMHNHATNKDQYDESDPRATASDFASTC